MRAIQTWVDKLYEDLRPQAERNSIVHCILRAAERDHFSIAERDVLLSMVRELEKQVHRTKEIAERALAVQPPRPFTLCPHCAEEAARSITTAVPPPPSPASPDAKP